MEHVNNLPYRAPEFMFFSRSAHARPGLGAEEYINPGDLLKYNELHEILDWRRMLSNFYARDDPNIPLFVVGGKKYRSVEHFFHASKFKISHPQKYNEFSLDSGSALSRATGSDVLRAGRSIRMSPAECRKWDGGESRVVMDIAHCAKFTQNPDLRHVLCLTDGAILKHRATQFGAVVVENDLMELRNMLIAEKK